MKKSSVGNLLTCLKDTFIFDLQETKQIAREIFDEPRIIVVFEMTGMLRVMVGWWLVAGERASKGSGRREIKGAAQKKQNFCNIF